MDSTEVMVSVQHDLDMIFSSEVVEKVRDKIEEMMSEIFDDKVEELDCIWEIGANIVSDSMAEEVDVYEINAFLRKG